MKKNIYLLIITLITIGCIIVGGIIHLGNGQLFGLNLGDTIESEETLSAFDSLHITGDVMGVSIVRGDDYEIKYEGTENLMPKYEITDGELAVVQKGKKTGFGNFKCSVTITIPEDASLQSFYADIDVGDINVTDMEIVTLTGESDVGDLNFTKITSQDVTITCDTGDIELSDCTFENLDINADVGNVDVKSAKDLSDYSFELSCDVGKVTINGDKESKNYESEGSEGSVTISADVGDVDITY